jgi:hypothetical protein
MKLAKDVEQWLAERPEPPREAMRRVVEILVGADPRMTVAVKNGTLTFHGGGGGDLGGFVQWKKATPISLMFMRGGIIPGDFPHLEGEGRAVRFMRFADVAEVNARAKELGKIAAAWCEVMESPPPKSKARTKKPKR